MTRRAIETLTFCALAWYAAAHWASGLVAGSSGTRVFACVAIAGAVAAALSLLAGAPTPQRVGIAAACTAAGIGAGFVAIGLDRRFLAPAHWDELGDGLDRGFAGLGSAEWPYAGEPWTALVLLLAIPLVLGVAAALASWPRHALRPFALVLLLALYGMAVTEHRFTGELGRGALLLVLVAAWLWLPQTSERGWQVAATAAAAVLVACVAALPAAARYEDHPGWVDYESWNPFAARAATRFDWRHSYGPIDWPRDGTTLMYVRSRERHYWKLETLDRFDGLRWTRSGLGRGEQPLLPDPVRGRWRSRFEVTIRDLDTDLFPIAGTMLELTGQGSIPVSRESNDGTVEAADESLAEGDSYTVDAYVPRPSPEQMRSASREVPPEISARYTTLFLPDSGRTALNTEPGDATGILRTSASRGAVAASPYGRVLRLARRLARGQETRYDVVRAVQRHLRSRYIYSERPPRSEYPLAAFLFEDEVGYCQQFSGAMALMLRMLDVPARVAAGFTPGSYNRDTKEYRVRDLDAHSWVEVWFDGIGWVPFDPTPSIAPADSQSSAEAASASGGSGSAGEIPDRRDGRASVPAPAGSTSRAGGEDGAFGIWLALASLLGLAALALGGLQAYARLRPGRPAASEEAEVAALRRALARVGDPPAPRLTLRQLEHRLEGLGGAPAARYVSLLRARRFGPRGGEAPDAAARRELRRALARGRGVRARLGALVALPPVSFRRG